MKFTLINILFLFLLLMTNDGLSKIYLAEVAEKVEDNNYSYTLKQFDSSAEFGVMNSKSIGVARSAYKFYSPSGDYLAVYLAKNRNESGELIIYLANNLRELFRVNVSIPVPSYGNQFNVYFNRDESIILLPNKQFNNDRKVNAYTINNGQLLYSYPLPKKGYLIGQSLLKDTFYIGVKYKPRGYSSVEIIDLKTGKLLNKLEKKRTRYNYIGHIRRDIFVSSYEKTRKHYEYELIALDNESGKPSLTVQSGNVKPVFATKKDGENILFLSRVKGTGALQINQLIDDKVVKLAHLPFISTPSFLLVNKHANKYLVAGEKSYVLVDSGKQTISGKIHRPFNIKSGFFSKNGSHVYVRQTIGQGNPKIAVIDFDEGKTINISGTGSKVAKFENLVVSVASAAVSGYLTGYMYVATHAVGSKMLLTQDESKLYVLNQRTNDITVFDAKDLSDRHSILTGLGTFAVYQSGNENNLLNTDNNIFVLSKMRISYFSDSSSEKIKEIKFKSLLNFDLEEDLLFVKDIKGKVNVYRLSTGDVIGSINNTKDLNNIDFFIPLKKQ